MNIKPTHYGTMFGVPVYIDMTDPECPEIEVQKKWMEPLLDVMEFLLDASFISIRSLTEITSRCILSTSKVLIGNKLSLKDGVLGSRANPRQKWKP